VRGACVVFAVGGPSGYRGAWEIQPALARELRIVRTLYWALWFVAAPLCLALLLVWALTPPSGVDQTGVLGWIESAVREQPVPVAIVAFTLFEMALWAARHELPFSRHALPALREGVPETLRTPFERARALLDEADGILTRHEKSVIRELSAKERDQLNSDLEDLRAAVDKTPFDEESFLDSLVKADGEVDVRLRPWRKSELREYLESILVAIAVALGLRAFVVEAFKIPSGSMIPTLQVGDHIFVNKFIYGPAIPWTQSRVWTHMPPKRGDVIVLAYPEHPEQDFIKRVIAVPGDKLEARNGHPWVNGWEVPNCPVGLYSYTEMDSAVPKHEGDLFVEYLGDEAYLALYDRATAGFQEYQGPFHAKPGEVWVMGDNRNNSHDSRMWWGNKGGGVPFANIRGRALFVWLSVLDGNIDWLRFGVPVMGRPRMPAAMAALQPALDKCLRDRPPIEKTTPPPPSKTAEQMSGPDNEEHPKTAPADEVPPR
jgi:signal peptidase I